MRSPDETVGRQHRIRSLRRNGSGAEPDFVLEVVEMSRGPGGEGSYGD